MKRLDGHNGPDAFAVAGFTHVTPQYWRVIEQMTKVA